MIIIGRAVSYNENELMEVIMKSMYQLFMAVGIVVLLDICRVAIKVIWHDIKKLDEAEEQETNDNE